MSSALSLEKSMTVANWSRGDFHSSSGHPRFGSSLRYSPQKTITMLRGSEQEPADYGVVPVENSTEGVSLTRSICSWSAI